MSEDIYSTVPVRGMDEYDPLKPNILKVLRENPGSFIKAKKLAEMTGYPIGGTQVQLRKAITELIEEQLQPIVSNEKGFAYTDQPGMLIKYIDDLENRKQGLQRRIDAINRIMKEGPHKETTSMWRACPHCTVSMPSSKAKIVRCENCNNMVYPQEEQAKSTIRLQAKQGRR